MLGPRSIFYCWGPVYEIWSESMDCVFLISFMSWLSSSRAIDYYPGRSALLLAALVLSLNSEKGISCSSVSSSIESINPCPWRLLSSVYTLFRVLLMTLSSSTPCWLWRICAEVKASTLVYSFHEVSILSISATLRFIPVIPLSILASYYFILASCLAFSAAILAYLSSTVTLMFLSCSIVWAWRWFYSSSASRL